MRTLPSLAPLAGLVLAAACLLTPATASAGELQLGGHLRIGGADLSDDDVDDDAEPDLGIAGIGQLFVVYKFVDAIGVGVVLDGGASSHEVDNADDNATTTTGTIGAMVRSDPLPFLGLAVWLGYTWGELEYEADTILGTFDFSWEGEGFGLGVDVFYRLNVVADLYVELGPYLTFGTYEADDNNGDDNTLLTTFGFMAQLTYEIGL